MKTPTERARLAHLIAQVDVALLDAPDDRPAGPGDDVPGGLVTFTDGTLRHRVRNTRPRLLAYRAQLASCPGFRADPGEAKRIRARWQKQGLRGTSCGLASNGFLAPEFRDMWDEENARELSRCILGPGAATVDARGLGTLIGERVDVCGFVVVVSRQKGGWRCTEPETGLAVGDFGKNRNQAITNARLAAEKAGPDTMRRAIEANRRPLTFSAHAVQS